MSMRGARWRDVKRRCNSLRMQISPKHGAIACLLQSKMAIALCTRECVCPCVPHCAPAACLDMGLAPTHFLCLPLRPASQVRPNRCENQAFIRSIQPPL